MRIAIACLLLSTACTDMTDEEPASESVATAAASVWNDCQVGSGYANALVYEPPDFYTRSGYTINQTCDCFDWQHDKNLNGKAHADTAYPTCRPQTIADFGLHVQQTGYRLVAEVPAWHTITSKDICESSSLRASVQWWTGTGGYVEIDSTDSLPQGAVKPVWNNGACQPIWWKSIQVSAGMNVQLRAKATRGTDADEMGYEMVKLYAIPY